MATYRALPTCLRFELFLCSLHRSVSPPTFAATHYSVEYTNSMDARAHTPIAPGAMSVTFLVLFYRYRYDNVSDNAWIISPQVPFSFFFSAPDRSIGGALAAYTRSRRTDVSVVFDRHRGTASQRRGNESRCGFGDDRPRFPKTRSSRSRQPSESSFNAYRHPTSFS